MALVSLREGEGKRREEEEEKGREEEGKGRGGSSPQTDTAEPQNCPPTPLHHLQLFHSTDVTVGHPHFHRPPPAQL